MPEPVPLIRELTTPALQVEHVRMPALLRLRGHGHAEPHLCIVLDGAFEERGGTSTLVTAGTLRSSPAGDQHDLQFSHSGARCLIILLGDDLIEEAPLPKERSFVRSARALANALEICNALAESPVLVELQVLELIADIRIVEKSRSSGRMPPWLTRVRDRLHAAPLQVTTADLASEAGLHPVYVARAFRRWYGCSIASYARRLRLDYARRMLADSRDPLARVAVLCGYADQSHLTRALRKGLGLTPATLRRQVAAVQDSRHAAS